MFIYATEPVVGIGASKPLNTHLAFAISMADSVRVGPYVRRRHRLTQADKRKGIKKLLKSRSKRARPLQKYWRERGKREGWL